MRADTKPKARRNARPKGGHCEGRGLCVCPYRNISQLVRRLLPDQKFTFNLTKTTLLTIFNDFRGWNTEKSITEPHSIMDLIYYGPLFRSAIPVKDHKGFVQANTKRGLGSINKQNQREN